MIEHFGRGGVAVPAPPKCGAWCKCPFMREGHSPQEFWHVSAGELSKPWALWQMHCVCLSPLLPTSGAGAPPCLQTRQCQHTAQPASFLCSPRSWRARVASTVPSKVRFFPELLFAMIKSKKQPKEEHFWKRHQPHHAPIMLLSPRLVPDIACLSETTLLRSGAPFLSPGTNDVKRWCKKSDRFCSAPLLY